MRRKRNEQTENFRRTAITTDEYNQVKAEAIAAEPLVVRVQASDISVESDSLKYNYINVKGKPVHVTSGLFKDLARCFSINAQLVKDLSNDDKTGGSGTEFLTKLVAAIGSFKTANYQGDTGITMVLNEGTQTITSAVPSKSYSRVTNSNLFNMADNILNRYPELKPYDVTNQHGLKTSIALLSDRPVDFKAPVGGIFPENEAHQFGIILGNTPTQTQLGDFALRLVCTNGIAGMRGDFRFKLDNLGKTGIEDFYGHIGDYAKAGFIPGDFSMKLEYANKTEASFREVEAAYVAAAKMVNAEDKDVKKHLKGTLAENFFWGYSETYRKLSAQGVKPDRLSDKQKAFIKSGQCIWDVINSITWLGSHDGGFGMEGRQSLTGLGGKMFANEFDLQYASLL